MQTAFYSIMVFLGSVVALSTTYTIFRAVKNSDPVVLKRLPKELALAVFVGIVVGVFFAKALGELVGSHLWVASLGAWVGFTFVFLNLAYGSKKKAK
jgi:hypothetical protein